MEAFDLVNSLKSLGLDEKTAENLKSLLRGDDLMNLINALNTEDLGRGIAMANEILGKYNVILGGSNQVEEYRKAEMEALKRGDLFAVENFINEWLAPVSTSLAEGFNYAVELGEDSMDKVLDWLDENKIEYLAQTPSVFQIKCEDRAAAYRVSKALSSIMGRAVVRDSQEVEDELVSEKKADRRIRDAKAKLDNMKDRNPVVQGMIGRGGGGAHKGGNAKKHDADGRNAKYKPRYDEDFDLEGDELGELPMNEENDGERLEEGVMGMQGLEPIFRLKELAGIRGEKKIEETDLVPVEDEEPELDGPLAPGPVDMGDELPADDMAMDADPAMDLDPAAAADMAMDAPADDMGMDMGMDDMGMGDMAADPMGGDLGALDADPMGGMPGDLPPMPTEPVLGIGMPNQSEAMMTIEDSLNGIQSKLPEIRLSEYKSLLIKLQDLTAQVQNMGRDYLGERRYKK